LVIFCSKEAKGEVFMREWRYNSTILDGTTIWRWVVGFTLQPVCPREGAPPVPIG
jgi:hypothetical protein